MRWIKKSPFTKSEAGFTSSKEPLVPPLKDETWKLVSNALCGLLILVVVVLLPCVLYVTVFAGTSSQKPVSSTCMIISEYRVRCGDGVNKIDCESMGCCWNTTECFHSLPSQHGYSVSNWSGSDSLDKRGVLSLMIQSQLQTPLGTAKKPILTVSATAVSPDHLRLQMSESHPISMFVGRTLNNSKFRAVVEGPEFFSVQILRREGSQTLLSTALGPIIASEGYWEITLDLPKQGTVFGLGTLGLHGSTQSVVRALYNREDQPDAQPFLLYLDERGHAHGILIHTKGPLEAEVMPSNLLILRAIYPWDISVFAGPTPGDVYSQMTSAITVPAVPPPWAFGFHVCRDTDDWMEEMEKFMKNAMELGLPYESDCIHERLVAENLNFTVPIKAQEAFVTIRDAGKRLLLSLPPHVSPGLAETYSEMMVQEENKGNPRVEDFDGRPVCYLDVEHPNASSWLKDQLAHLNIPADFQISGYVLQDNWPAAGVNLDSPPEDLPYIPQALNSLSNGTLWWQARHYGGVPHVQVHNDYGKSHAHNILLMNPNALVLSASTSTGSGSAGGSHHQRRVGATWLDMKQAFHTLLGLSLAGIPLASNGPVCGSEPGEFDEHLCTKWYWLNSLLPLMRVSSAAPLRDPTNLKTLAARKSATNAVRFRYSLLPYLIWTSHLGAPIARPMFFDWPGDLLTRSLDEQFMLGPALLVRPVFTSQLVTMQLYLPSQSSWYHFRSGVPVSPNNGSIANVVDFDDVVVLIRGGYIVPTQEPQATVRETLARNYTFVAALSKIGDARGELHHHLEGNSSYLTYQLEANETTLRVRDVLGGCSHSTVFLDTVVLYGVSLPSGVPRVSPAAGCILGQAAAIEPVISIGRNVTRIVHLALDLCCSGLLGEIFLEWT